MTVIPFPRRPELAEQRSDERTEQLIDRALWEPRDRHPQLAEAQDERDRSAARGQWDRADRIDRQLALARHAADRAHLLDEHQAAVAAGDPEARAQALAHLEVLDDELARDHRNDPELDDPELDDPDLELDEELQR